MIPDNVQNVAENYHSDNGKHQKLKTTVIWYQTLTN